MTLRDDLVQIAKFIKPATKVLDIGCCDGELLSYLVNEKAVDGRGMDISQSNVSTCVKNGLSVVQGDADMDLKFYPDKCFDYVISSQMLQATHMPLEVLEEMIRIAKCVIVSIPNFGHWYNRLYLSVVGKMPVSSTLSYQWYETPNIHFCTVADFEILCNKQGYEITKKRFTGGLLSAIWPNLFCKNAIFMLKK